jgi:hypothetical protein
MPEHHDHVHIDTPIDDMEEIPYDPAMKTPRNLRIELRFDGDEIDRIKVGTPRPVYLHEWMKQAILEKADREAAAKSNDSLQAAD